MRTSVTSRFTLLVAVTVLSSSVGCEPTSRSYDENAAEGGATAQPGSTLTAGGNGGNGGATGKGGATLQGGTTVVSSSGGTAGNGSSSGSAVTGGTTAQGGASSTGGTTAKGGASSTGGTTAKGGASSTGGSSSAGGSSSDPYASARALCLQLTNEYRATVSAAALTMNASKDSCVDGQAKSDSVTGTAHDAFGDCKESAQNECPGWDGTPESVVTKCLAQMFAEGPGADYNAHGHYINMTKTSYTQLTCGFYTTSDNKIWLIQNYY